MNSTPCLPFTRSCKNKMRLPVSTAQLHETPLFIYKLLIKSHIYYYHSIASNHFICTYTWFHISIHSFSLSLSLSINLMPSIPRTYSVIIGGCGYIIGRGVVTLGGMLLVTYELEQVLLICCSQSMKNNRTGYSDIMLLLLTLHTHEAKMQWSITSIKLIGEHLSSQCDILQLMMVIYGYITTLSAWLMMVRYTCGHQMWPPLVM